MNPPSIKISCTRRDAGALLLAWRLGGCLEPAPRLERDNQIINNAFPLRQPRRLHNTPAAHSQAMSIVPCITRKASAYYDECTMVFHRVSQPPTMKHAY